MLFTSIYPHGIKRNLEESLLAIIHTTDLLLTILILKSRALTSAFELHSNVESDFSTDANENDNANLK